MIDNIITLSVSLFCLFCFDFVLISDGLFVCVDLFLYLKDCTIALAWLSFWLYFDLTYFYL